MHTPTIVFGKPLKVFVATFPLLPSNGETTLMEALVLSFSFRKAKVQTTAYVCFAVATPHQGRNHTE